MDRSSQIGKLFIAISMLVMMLTPAADAAPIEYVFSVTRVSGGIDPDGDVLDPIEFDNANMTISIFGDTESVIIDELGPFIPDLDGTVSLFGGDLPTTFFGSFVDPLYVYVDPFGDLIGFGTGSDFTAGGDTWDQLVLEITGIGAYDLKSPIGPLTATSIVFWAIDTPISFGGFKLALVIDDIESPEGASFAAVPEPTSMLLIATGMIALVAWRRRGMTS